MTLFNPKHPILQTSITLLLVWLLSACNPLSGIEPPLRVGTNVWPGYEPLYLARKLNAWQDAPIRLVEFTSATDVMHAMRSGSLEAAALTLDEALGLLQDGMQLRVILVMDFSNGGDALLARPGINTVEQLRGKRVAVENPAVGAVLLEGALQSAGMSIKDIRILSCTAGEHEQCYQQADALVTFEPVKTRLLKQGARLLFDSSRIPNRIVDVLVVTEDTLSHNPETLQTLLQGYFQARDYMNSYPTEAAAMMAPRMGLQSDEVIKAFGELRLPDLDENRRLLSAKPPGLQAIAENMMQLMLQHGLLKHQPDISQLSEGRFVEAMQP